MPAITAQLAFQVASSPGKRALRWGGGRLGGDGDAVVVVAREGVRVGRVVTREVDGDAKGADVMKDWKKAQVRRREVMALRRWGRRVVERRRADSRPLRSKVLEV